MPSLLVELSNWHRRHCDGEREHWYGITIQTTDNPGWWVKVDLNGTPLEARRFERVAEAVDGNGYPHAARWINCEVTGNIWHGAGDASRLEEIVSLFLHWAEAGD